MCAIIIPLILGIGVTIFSILLRYIVSAILEVSERIYYIQIVLGLSSLQGEDGHCPHWKGYSKLQFFRTQSLLAVFISSIGPVHAHSLKELKGKIQK